MPTNETKPSSAGEDLYGEGDESPVSKPKTDAEGEEGKEGGKEAGQTTLVPESFCPNMEVGDSVVATIRSKMDGQYELEYEAQPKEKEAAPEKAPAPEGDAEMAGFME